jgi:hypothetical protein
MRTLRLSLAGTVISVMVGVLPLGVAAQTDGDEPRDAASDSLGEVSVVEDLVYATGSSPDGEVTELKLRLHLPAESEDAPMVISVGGTAVNAKALAEQGVSVFVTGSPDRWPDIILYADPAALRTMAEAVACAVRFARGSEYGSETAPLVLTGFSAYAPPAAHVALAGEDFDRLWDEYAESAGGPPTQFECTVSEASTRVEGFMGVAGGYDAFVGFEGKYGRDHLQEHEPELWEMLWGTVGLHPELRVRLVHGNDDLTVPLEVSAAFEAVLAEAGYDVELLEFTGGHITPGDLTVETVLELLQ